MKKNSMYFLLGLILLSVSSVCGITLNSGAYETFGWKPISAPSNNVRVAFLGWARSDLHLAIRYATNQYVEIVIGGWNNGRGAVRNCTGSNGSSTIYVDAVVFPGKMPTTAAYVSYVVTIANSTLTVTANGASIMTYTNPSFLSKTFNAYSFKANMPSFPWTVMSDVGTSVASAPAVPAIPAGTFTGANVPTGYYWLQRANDTQFLDQAGGSWGANKHVFRITRNATNLSYASMTYPANSGFLNFVDANFWYVPAPAPALAPVPMFTGYYPNSSTSGYFSKTSTVSQYQADQLARDAWLNARVPTGTTLSSAAYTAFTWKPITSGSSNNIRIQWVAAASASITVGLQYSANQYIEVVIGGWRNNKSTVRNFTNGSFPGENLVSAPSGSQPIRDTFNPLTYVLTVAPSGSNGVLTVTSNGVVIMSFSAPFLNQVFTNYSFAADAQFPWRIASGEVVSSVPMVLTSTYNGYTGTGATQALADADAQAKWQAAVLANIASSRATAVNSATGVLNQITAANNLLIAARGSLKNIAVQLNYTSKLPWE